jgi:Rrf2 family protein
MILKSQVEWALHCCAILAGLPDGRYLSTKALAEFHGLPKEYLSKALQSLSQARLVDSTLGPSGGYRLSRPPADIRVGDVIRRLEGRLSVKDTAKVDDRSPGEVAVHLLNEKLTDATDAALDDLTLEQLLDHVSRSGSLQQMYYI